jgi:hypothetical protein
MNAIDIEKLNQLISRTDISGNDKVRWLTDFIDGREFEQQEKSYSEEEVLNKLTYFAVEIKRQNKQGIAPLRITEWFDRNKKK